MFHNFTNTLKQLYMQFSNFDNFTEFTTLFRYLRLLDHFKWYQSPIYAVSTFSNFSNSEKLKFSNLSNFYFTDNMKYTQTYVNATSTSVSESESWESRESRDLQESNKNWEKNCWENFCSNFLVLNFQSFSSLWNIFFFRIDWQRRR